MTIRYFPAWSAIASLTGWVERPGAIAARYVESGDFSSCICSNDEHAPHLEAWIGLRLRRMPRHVVLLRGVNLVRTNRVAMPALRAALEAAGFEDVRTYMQSGNVVLTSRAAPGRVASDVRALIKRRFGFDIVVLVRSHAELAEVVRRNPLARDVTDPKRYLVTFVSRKIPAELVARMRAVAGPQERLGVIGREVYTWHPAGVGRSPLWERLASKTPGVDATSRNWSTVTTLLEMAKPTADR